MTPDQIRHHATELILDHAREVWMWTILGHLAEEVPALPVADRSEPARAIADLIRTATITVDWPEPLPVRGCLLPDNHAGDCAAGDGRTWPGPHPGPAPDTSGGGSTSPGGGSAGDEPHPRAPEAAQAEFGPRWRVGRSWGVTIIDQPHDGPDRLAATAQTPADAARIVAALNAETRQVGLAPLADAPSGPAPDLEPAGDPECDDCHEVRRQAGLPACREHRDSAAAHPDDEPDLDAIAARARRYADVGGPVTGAATAADVPALVARVRQLETERGNRETGVKSLLTTIDRLDAEANAHEGEMGDLRSKLSATEADRDDARQAVTDLRKAERERDSLARRCAVRFEETEALRARVAELETTLAAAVSLADHPALEWLAIHLWQTARDGHGSMELHSRLSGWLADRQARGLDQPETAGGK